MEIKNLKKAASRILKAIGKKEKIILYGDADLDGAAAVIILKESLQNLGGKIAAVYFPDRESEGYGISEIGLNSLKKFAPALFIALDCGIGNFKEVIKANKLGFEVIIIDHHQILDGLPEASIIVDPKQEGDKYPFKGLAATGIVYKLSQVVLGNQMTESLKKSFLELVALATIADMMPREEENKIFIEQGLSSLEKSWRPGIQAVFETELFKGYDNISQKVSKMISILNVRDIQQGLPASFRLLTSGSKTESKELINNLLQKSELRKEKIREILEEIEEEISKQSEPIIFIGSSQWEFALLSPVATIICQSYQKPTFVFKKLKTESQGTVRTPSGIDSVSLMQKCSQYTLTYGGHPLASGFRIKNENLEKFKQCLIDNLHEPPASVGEPYNSH